MARYRPKNKFGRRFISLRELCDYAVDLDLDQHRPNNNFMEYLEREGLLAPIARTKFSHEILRRFMQEQSDQEICQPVEPDGPRLDAAINLVEVLEENRWQNPSIYGLSRHPLDEIDPAHSPFVATEFCPDSFVPWEELRAPVYTHEGREIRSSERFLKTYYHYWQVFWLAAILRSGVRIYYPLDDDQLGECLLRGQFDSEVAKGRMYVNLNIEARHHLNALREHRPLFELVGYFEAYRHNALQVHKFDRATDSGKLSQKATQQYRRQSRRIAHEALKISDLQKTDLFDFIGKQSEWWTEVKRIGPPAVADELKRNIDSSIRLYHLITREDLDEIVRRVGRRGGYFGPILKVIFPDWVEEQRDLTIRSMKPWCDDHLASIPTPFPVTIDELGQFCDWLEEAGLFQFYWHFRRIVDIGIRDGPVDRAATAAEAVGFANLVEQIANRALEERGKPVRGTTLFPKLRALFGPDGPVDLTSQLSRFSSLTNTKKSTLALRISQISRIRQGGPYTPIVRALLQTAAIRNEGSHLGLLKFDRIRLLKMLEVMALVCLVIWCARKK